MPVRLVNKIPETNFEFHEELTKSNWTLLKEPKNIVITILLSIPFMIFAPLISIALINMISGISFKEFGLTTNGITITVQASMVAWLILLVVVHEFIHLLFIPNFIKSKKTYVGFTWVGAFVITEEKISKTRYIIISIAPFVIISVILPLFLGAFGLLTTTFKVVILLNSMSSSLDLLGLLFITTQVPKKAILQNNGVSTYWKCL